MLERDVLHSVMLAVPEIWPGARVFRNNGGIAEFKGGQKVRYGLCKGSSDLIGWRPRVVDVSMLGATLAQFVAIECKAPGKDATASQARFLVAVERAGGLAIVAHGRDDIKRAKETP